ncbi:hypothetical protein BCS42_09240 [Crenothrix sp. D3]|nr:hypothetical protein BCS42_09240 [Crenothrix sp. D3]
MKFKMLKIDLIKLIFIFMFIHCAFAQDINSDTLFKGVIKQSHDYSCGAAALSTLITGTIENSHVFEMDIINIITANKAKKEEGYTLIELAEASKKLGFYAEWRKVATTELVKIKQPVMLLIGINSEFPHFVVLKGIENGEAFLADSIRGNIRTPYSQLITEGTNTKYPDWYVMAINPSANKPQDSSLYLSLIESERIRSHITAEQSNLITLTTITKEGQFIADYGFNASLGKNNNNGIRSHSRDYVNNLNISYGVTDNAEIGASVSYDDNRQKTDVTDNILITNGENREYSLYINNRFSLDETNQNGIIAGLSTSFTENRSVLNDAVDKYTVFGGGVNTMGYANTSFAQFIIGGSVNKAFSQNKRADASLAEYQVSGFVSANKPFADRYLGSVGFTVNDGHNKKGADNQFQRSFLASTSLSYVLSKQFQISPSVGYSFGNGESFSFGLDAAYIGRW